MGNEVNRENSKITYKEKGNSLEDIIVYIANNILINKNQKWADNNITNGIKLIQNKWNN